MFIWKSSVIIQRVFKVFFSFTQEFGWILQLQASLRKLLHNYLLCIIKWLYNKSVVNQALPIIKIEKMIGSQYTFISA